MIWDETLIDHEMRNETDEMSMFETSKGCDQEYAPGKDLEGN